MSSSRLVRLASIATFVVLLAPSLRAQSETEPTVCLGFAFGPWTPALNWRAAGHTSPLDPAVHQRADDARVRREVVAQRCAVGDRKRVMPDRVRAGVGHRSMRREWVPRGAPGLALQGTHQRRASGAAAMRGRISPFQGATLAPSSPARHLRRMHPASRVPCRATGRFVPSSSPLRP
jgi:hypothetical protein